MHVPSCTWKCFVVTNNMWCMCVCYLYCGYKNPVQSHCESIYGHNDKSVSWMCKSNVVHRLTSIKNDAIHSLYSRCNIKHSCKGKDLDICKSVSLQSPLQGCRMCTVTLQYNLSLSGEEPMKKEFSWAVLFFFSTESCVCDQIRMFVFV